MISLGWSVAFDCLELATSDSAYNYSINHEYKEWDEKNPQVSTCNQNTKNLVQGSTVPQDVDTNKEVVFTYDVTFKVRIGKTLVD